MVEGSIHNIREYSVSELAGAVKRVIEDGFGLVRVKGELGRVTRAASGHLYLDLKDESATISGVLWKGAAQRLKIAPEQGMEVAATGKLTTFPGQSKYQIIIDSLEPAGAGALMALLEERKKKLAAEGLFDASRKRALPYLPDVIGVVTSPSGAVIRDILHRLRERFARHVLVWPTLVQGRGAEVQIAAAIEGFNRLTSSGDVPRPDVIIVARGGGSLEDLWCFNEEIVVRAAAASHIPLISAVGHETDTTLIDFASDLRAPTPTAAAEKAVPMRSELLAEVINKQRRMIAAETRRVGESRLRLRSAARGLGRPEDATGALGQKLDFLSSRLDAGLGAQSARSGVRLSGVSTRLRPRLISNRIDDGRRSLDRDLRRLAEAGRRIFERPTSRLEAASALLNSLSYRNVLERGFALVRTAAGKMARRAKDLPAEGAVQLVFADGERAAELSRPAGKGRKNRPSSQGSLFE